MWLHRAFIGLRRYQTHTIGAGIPAVNGDALLHSRPFSVAYRVWLLDRDIYLDRSGMLVVLTGKCQEQAAVDTDVLLRWADSDEPELAFPSGQACPASFVSDNNAFVTSAMEDGYTEVYTGLAEHTANRPDLSSDRPSRHRLTLSSTGVRYKQTWQHLGPFVEWSAACKLFTLHAERSSALSGRHMGSLVTLDMEVKSTWSN